MDAARRPRKFLTLTLLLLTAPRVVMHAQCSAAAPSADSNARIAQLYSRQDWTGVVRLAEALRTRDAEVDFDLGMSLAHLGRWSGARQALLAGEHACPGQKRFSIELAGVAFEQKQNAEAARWLRRGLHLDPKDQYANNFLGTVYYLSGNLDAALKYWNRVQKPRIAALDLDAHARVHRLLLDRSFAFAPESVMLRSQLAATETRLNGLGIFPAWNLRLDPRPDGAFNAVFRAEELDGFGGSRLQALAATLGGLPYATFYPSYTNIGRSAMNADSLLRWDAQKRRAWISLSAPMHELPQWRWDISADWRAENWAIRRSFTGAAPLLGSFHLERELAAANFSGMPGGRLRWSLGGELSHRTFTDVTYGSALSSALLTPGFLIKQLASLDSRLIDVPQRRFTLDAGASSELGRTLGNSSHMFEKLQGHALAHWYPQFTGDRYELTQRLRAGKIFGTVPVDEFYLLGMDRDDTDLWLRGHIATRDGRKGSAPVGDGYMLANADFYRRIYSNGLITIHAGPLLDISRVSAPTSGLATKQWLFDTGVEARLTVLHTSVVLSYGRDLRNGANAFYGTLSPQNSVP